jgi:CID domain
VPFCLFVATVERVGVAVAVVKDHHTHERICIQKLRARTGLTQDKVIINTLSMVAEDYAASDTSARKLYSIVRTRLLTCSGPNTLPVLYVLDSILKNVQRPYVTYVEEENGGDDDWMTMVCSKLDRPSQLKLQRVWKTWNERPYEHLFDPIKWNAMGRCFSNNNTAAVASNNSSTTASGSTSGKMGAMSSPQFPPVAGIPRTVRCVPFFGTPRFVCVVGGPNN